MLFHQGLLFLQVKCNTYVSTPTSCHSLAFNVHALVALVAAQLCVLLLFQLQQQPRVKSVAWMVVFGDGMHNFIDGLSIGAAFSHDLLAGVSVSIAVICEELPHELGQSLTTHVASTRVWLFNALLIRLD